MLEKFETAPIAPSDRLHYWNELVSRIYGGTFVNAPHPEFSAEMWRWCVGDLHMIRPRSDPSMVGRRPDGSGGERVVLHLQCRGASHHRQNGREADLQPGDFALSLANEAYDIDLATRHELLVVEFPKAELLARLPDLDDRFLKLVPGGSVSSRVFHDFLLSLWRQGDQSASDPEWQSGVSRVFYDLIALAVRGASPDRQHSIGSPLRDRVLALVEARLCDPELRAASMADELGVSSRTIQNVFAAMGATPGGYVLERRLARAADRLLASPGLSITELAFELGFNDSAYFTRCFRAHFGSAPKAWRGLN